MGRAEEGWDYSVSKGSGGRGRELTGWCRDRGTAETAWELFPLGGGALLLVLYAPSGEANDGVAREIGWRTRLVLADEGRG